MLKDILKEWNNPHGSLIQKAREEAKKAVEELSSGNIQPIDEVAKEIIDIVINMDGYSGTTPIKVRIPVFPDEI